MKLIKSPLFLLTLFFSIIAGSITLNGFVSYFFPKHLSNTAELNEVLILINNGDKFSAKLNKYPISVTKISSDSSQNNGALGAIEGQFTLAFVLITIATLTYQAHRNTLEDSKKNSKFYLKNYKQASEMILNRLNSDTPTRRISWVTASRMAHMLTKLEDKITEKADKEMLEIHQRNLAHDINAFFFDKPALYYTGRDQAQSWDDAFQRAEIIALPGLIPKIPQLPYIPKETIMSILDITNPIWEKESGYKYTNQEEFKSIVKFNYPNVAEYFLELEKRHQ